MFKVSIIIPTLNESGNVGPLLGRLSDVLSNVDYSYQVIVVDNGSDDGTCDELQNLQEKHEFLYIANPVNNGLSHAVLTGAIHAQSENIVVMDADLSHPPESVPSLIEELNNSSNTMVLGSRYCPGGSTPDWPLYRKVASQIASIPARILTDVRDPLSGFFAVKKDHLLKYGTNAKGFKLGLQLLSSNMEQEKQGQTVSEVPIVFSERTKGKSKMNMKVISDYLVQLCGLFGADFGITPKKVLAPLFMVSAFLDFLLTWYFLEVKALPPSYHIFGAILSLLVPYVCLIGFHLKNKTELSSKGGWRVFLCLACLIPLRGGIFAIEPTISFLNPWLWLTILLTGSIGYFSTIFYILAPKVKHFSRTSGLRILAALCFYYFLFLRLIYIGNIELIEEEAYYWNYSKHMAMGYLDHPPMIANLVWTGTTLFGDNEFGVRIGAYICWLITAFFTYKITRLFSCKGVGLTSLMLVSILPFYYGVGLLATPDAPLTACWAGTLYFLYRVLVLEEKKYWAGVAIFLGLGMLSKYTIVLLGPAIVLYMLCDSKSRKWFFKPHAYLTAIAAFVIFSPVIIWNMNNEWASFVFQGKNRVEGVFEFSSHVLLGSALVLITPAGILGYLHFLRHGLRQMTDLSEFPIGRRAFLFFFLMTIVPLSVFAFFSISKEVKFNWTGPLWLAFIPYFSWLLHTSKNEVKSKISKTMRRIFPATALFCILFLSFVPHYLTLGFPKVPFLFGPYLGGWSSLAEQIETKVKEQEDLTGQRPIVVGMDKYQIASGVSFYRYKLREKEEKGDNYTNIALTETTSANALGFRGLMYGFWHGLEEFRGKDLLIVAHKEAKVRVQLGLVHGMPKKFEIMEPMPVSRYNVPIGVYHTRVLRQYKLSDE